ncbi:MAG: helix-hairpin-helix domain-containing protein [Candidatus Tectomicrobia bacterium]|nr:helix-hairpin-helix domain-containing protein [Candidatus Tectomicrobia bacterium]
MKRFVRGFSVLALVLLVLTTGGLFAQGKVDINSADVKELMSLKGIGEVRANAIVKYRQTNGPFQSLDDLKHVSGIGDKIIQDNRSTIALGKGSGGKMSGKPAKTMPKGASDTKSTSEKAMKDTKDKTKKATSKTQ